MSRSFSLPLVLRNIPRTLLKAFFEQLHIPLVGVDGDNSPADIGPLRVAIGALPTADYDRVEGVLHDVFDLACVKAPFSDGEGATPTEGNPGVEHMWLGEVDFDGRFVSGELLNAPNWLKTVSAGDSARMPLAEISDWMYVIDNAAYGRSR